MFSSFQRWWYAHRESMRWLCGFWILPGGSFRLSPLCVLLFWMLIENQTTAFGYFDRRDEVVCTSANEAVYRFASVLFFFFSLHLLRGSLN